ncbi:hypothetical protein JQM63_07735 [Oscillibacter valericigenes]|nr:hypothetical protein [Oscillibacter valericigenes]
MGHKNNNLPKGVGAALQSVSKLFWRATAKESRPQNNMSKVVPALPSDVDKCQSEEFEAQESTAVAPNIEEPPVANDVPSSFQTVAEELTSPAIVEEETSSYNNMVVAYEGTQIKEGEVSDGNTSTQDDLTPELPTLNYEVSKDYRSLLMQQCKQAADNCADALRKREPPNQAPAQIGDEAQPFLFDVVNCRMSDFSGSGTSTQMPIFCCMDDKEPILCNPHGIYTQMLVDCYELFHDDREETRHLRHSILRRSLEEVIGRALPAAGCRFMCLMPDIVDDFDQVFRAQLNYSGAPLFQVPRSIALAYTLQAEGWSLPDEFLCLDYDGEDFFAIKLCKVMDENGDHIFIRMGREKLPGKHHPSTRELSIEYLHQYQEKYGLHLSENAVSNLVNTKRLQHLLFDQSRYLLLDNDGKVTPLYADTEILAEIAERIYSDMDQIQDDTGMIVYAMCALFKDPNGRLYNISQMESGCRAICERADQRKTLWQEYLPDLKLEVNRDGCFDQIQLIGNGDRRQNINTFVLDEKVRIPVIDGTVTFPANGAKYYDLPLVREVFGRHAKEKLARFVLEKPLNKPVEVELSVHYQYGDIDSYQLVAYSRELDQTIYSCWLDTETLELPNPAPSFSEVTLDRRIIDEEDIKEVYEAFLLVHDKIVNPVRPARHKYGSVYAIPKNSTRYYSKYLFELNKGGMPYFAIQNFFKRESLNKTLPYISKLFATGVFSAIGGVLCGDLPANHDLGEDEQTGQDESRVLINNMADIASNFGVFFALKDKDEESEKIFNIIERILSFYKRKKYPKVQHWAPMTKYVRSAKDPHDIWNYFRVSLKQMQPQRPRSTIYDLRAISGVCFQTETWIFDLFHGPNGRDEVEGIIENIIATLYDRDCLSERNPQDKYNPRKIRDVLELLLCICRLKAEDPSILDCNEQRTKLLVKQLKKIDSDIRKMGEDGRLKHSFNSRLGITAPEAYSRVNPVIYALIETLSGGEQVSLIGFSDEEDDD